MSENRFVVQEEHFHIADKDCYVLTGWFDGKEAAKKLNVKLQEQFEVFLDCERLKVQVLCFEDGSVQQKYSKYGINVRKEYVILAKLPPNLSRYRRLFLRLADGRKVCKRRVSRLRKQQGLLNCQITNIQSTGASCVVSGWAVSENPIKINVLDDAGVPMKCEVRHFQKPDIALEYREANQLSDSGFHVTIPVNGSRSKMVLQITDGETSVSREIRTVDRNRLMAYIKKADDYLKRNGIKKTCKRAVNELYELIRDTGNYAKWRENHKPTQKELEQQRQDKSTFQPLIYVITPYQDFHHFTWAAISMKNQTYENWKWVLACTAAEKEKLMERLHAYVSESQLLFVSAEGQEGYEQRIAQAVSEVAARMQKQEADKLDRERISDQKTGQMTQQRAWMTILAPSDTIEPEALYRCVKMFEQYPAMDMCYTDEDQISEDGKTFQEPVFKPDFNIDMLRAFYYLGHMVLLRADIISRLGAWNPAYGLDAPYDYYLRAAEAAQWIGHLPHAVYHVREGSKQTRYAGEMILNAHYKRLGIPAVVKRTEIPGIYRTAYQWEEIPLVSVNIPNKDHVEDLDICVQSILKKCTYPNYEIIIIENNSTQESTFAYYRKLQDEDHRIRVEYFKEEFNYSKITNFGVAKSKGDYILLLNNDTEVITPDFMEEMIGYCMREEVGICGARLFYFDDTVQHAGVVIGLVGICGEVFQGFSKESRGYQNRIVCPQDYSAVTAACLMTKKSVFQEVGGMDEDLQIAYNDIDYCLKVRKSGKLVVYNPFAMLHHYEYKSRGAEDTADKRARYHREVEIFTSRWKELIQTGDPYYNPNLTKRYHDFSLKRTELLK